MTDRIRLDDLTSDELDALYSERDRLAATVARMKRTNRMVNGGARDFRDRAEQAEARVRELETTVPQLADDTALRGQIYAAMREAYIDRALLDGASPRQQIETLADAVLPVVRAAVTAERAALERVRTYLEARLNQVAVDPAEVFNVLTGAAEQHGDVTAPAREQDSVRIVAHQSRIGRYLVCLRHVPPPAARAADHMEVTSEDLPDGGICTYPGCGVDVLAALAREQVIVTAHTALRLARAEAPNVTVNGHTVAYVLGWRDEKP